jgi:hypothetical protein
MPSIKETEGVEPQWCSASIPPDKGGWYECRIKGDVPTFLFWDNIMEMWFNEYHHHREPDFYKAGVAKSLEEILLAGICYN